MSEAIVRWVVALLILDYSEKNCQGQSLQLIRNIRKLRDVKSFVTLALGRNVLNFFRP
jgi:hypothetical protein